MAPISLSEMSDEELLAMAEGLDGDLHSILHTCGSELDEQEAALVNEIIVRIKRKIAEMSDALQQTLNETDKTRLRFKVNEVRREARKIAARISQ